jgi:hypothetical protein
VDDRSERRGTEARLVELEVADEPMAWAAAGFSVSDDLVHLGPVSVRCVGPVDAGPGGIVGWTISGLDITDGALDGLTTRRRADVGTGGAPTSPPPSPPHPNGVVGFDHVVVLTPDLDRTVAAVEAAGLCLRRIRETSMNGSPMRQAFFKLGPVVLEVVSGDVGTGLPADEAPATFFGLALDVDDLDASASHLGAGLGRIKPAVQAGRRIATVRHHQLGLSVPVALMDHHGERTTADDGR